MTHRERIELLFAVTLCVTLLVAVAGILALMWRGVNVAAPVSLAVCAQWGIVAGLLFKSQGGGRDG